jgi:hypothetical protein
MKFVCILAGKKKHGLIREVFYDSKSQMAQIYYTREIIELEDFEKNLIYSAAIKSIGQFELEFGVFFCGVQHGDVDNFYECLD